MFKQIGILFFVGLLAFSCNTEPSGSESDKITWLSWEEAQEKMKENPKMVFVDVYTDWCGWCKKMDRQTFTDPKVAAYMNDHYYAVKFDAEQKEPATYMGQTMNFRPGGRRGVHQLAVVLLNGRLGYPSFAYLDENMNRIHVSPGYKTAEQMLAELKQVVKR